MDGYTPNKVTAIRQGAHFSNAVDILPDTAYNHVPNPYTNKNNYKQFHAGVARCDPMIRKDIQVVAVDPFQKKNIGFVKPSSYIIHEQRAQVVSSGIDPLGNWKSKHALTIKRAQETLQDQYDTIAYEPEKDIDYLRQLTVMGEPTVVFNAGNRIGGR